MLILVLVENYWKWSCGDWRQGELTHSYTLSDFCWWMFWHALTTFSEMSQVPSMDQAGIVVWLSATSNSLPLRSSKRHRQQSSRTGKSFLGSFCWPSVSRQISAERGKRDLQLRIQKTIKILEEQARQALHGVVELVFGWFLDVNGCESSEILAGFSWNYYYGYYGVSKLDDAGLWHIGVPMCGIARSLFVWSRHSLPDCGQLEQSVFANADDVEEIHTAASKIKWHSTPLSKIMLQVISYVWIWKPMVIRATPCVTNAPYRAAGTRGSNHHLRKHCGGVPFLRNGALVACREKEKLFKRKPWVIELSISS